MNVQDGYNNRMEIHQGRSVLMTIAAALALLCAVAGGVHMLARPAWAQAPVADAATTSLLANADFGEWAETAPRNWGLGGGAVLTRQDQAPAKFNIKAQGKDFGDLNQFLSKPEFFHPGDTVLYTVFAKCSAPDAFRCQFIVYDADNKQLVSGIRMHSGNGQWESLSVEVVIPEQAVNYTIGMRVMAAAAEGAEVAYARATIVPAVP